MADLNQRLRDLGDFTVSEPRPVEQLARLVTRRRRRRLLASAGCVALLITVAFATGVWSAAQSDRAHVRVGQPSPSDVSRPGGGLSLTYIPEGFALVDDVEHVRHQLGDRLRVLTYRSDKGSGATFQVHRKIGNPLNVAAELQLDPRTVPTKVNGHDAIFRADAQLTLGWLQTSDVTLWVTSGGLGEAEIRRIAEGIRYDAAEDEPTSGIDPGVIDPGDQNRRLSEPVVVTSGEVGAITWKLEVYESDSGLCIDLRYDGGAGGGCGFGVPQQRVLGIATARGGGLQSVFGPVRTDVATVDLHFASGEVATVTPAGEGLGFPVQFYVAVLATEDPVSVVIARDADGREVGREAVPDRTEKTGN